MRAINSPVAMWGYVISKQQDTRHRWGGFYNKNTMESIRTREPLSKDEVRRTIEDLRAKGIKAIRLTQQVGGVEALPIDIVLGSMTAVELMTKKVLEIKPLQGAEE